MAKEYPIQNVSFRGETDNFLTEAVFGQMKADMHYKRFRHFGMDKVYMDLGLFGMGFNLKKYLGIKR